MKIRTALATFLTTAALGTGVLGLADPAGATPSFSHNGQLSCGYGQVVTSGPSVTANQGTAQNPNIWWIAELIRWDGSRWVHAQWSSWFVDTVESDSGFSLGSTWGYAGGAWFRYGEMNSVGFGGYSSLRFDVPSGGYYAIRNFVYDGTYSSAIAVSSTGGTWCRA